MQELTDCLYLISNNLMTPVLIALILMLAWTLSLLGGFCREALERRRVLKALEACMTIAKSGNAGKSGVWTCLSKTRAGLPERFCKKVGAASADKGVLNQALIDTENDVAAAMAALSFSTRLGPMLGLMATLIPLGPALAGLASGNVRVMAANMVVIFTATVVGLLIGCVAFGMGLVRRTWYARDLSALEFLCLKLSGAEGTP